MTTAPFCRGRGGTEVLSDAGMLLLRKQTYLLLFLNFLNNHMIIDENNNSYSGFKKHF